MSIEKVAAVKVSGIPEGSPGIGMTLHNYLKLRQEDWAFVTPYQPLFFERKCNLERGNSLWWETVSDKAPSYGPSPDDIASS